MRRPVAITKYMAEFGQSESETRKYILDQLRFFDTITHKGTTEAGWLAFKMGCTLAAAKNAIAWVNSSDDPH